MCWFQVGWDVLRGDRGWTGAAERAQREPREGRRPVRTEKYLSEVTGSICTVTLLLVYCVFAQPSVTTSGVERAGLIVLLSYITVVLSATVSSINSWIKRTV